MKMAHQDYPIFLSHLSCLIVTTAICSLHHLVTALRRRPKHRRCSSSSISIGLSLSFLYQGSNNQRMGSLRNLTLLKRRTFSIWKSMNSTSSNAMEKPFLASFLSNTTYQLHPNTSLVGHSSLLSYGRNLCSQGKSLFDDASQGPAAIDYRYDL